MKTASFAFTLLSITLLSVSHSKASLFQPAAQPTVETRKPSSRSTEKCTDFSGKWKGTCTMSNDSFSNTVEIHQYKCNFLTEGRDDFEIGGVFTQARSQTTQSTALDWNVDKTSLKMVGTGLSPIISIGTNDPEPRLSGHWINSVTGEMRLNDGKMVVVIFQSNGTLKCIYEKQE